MDPRLLQHYNRELLHLREMGAEFAKAFPNIAGRLGMEGIEVHDPYVERLLEGTAFLAARVQLKLDAEFPRFSQRLLGMLYPHYMAPTPAMLIAQFQPMLTDANLASGSVVPRGTVIRGAPGKNDFSPSQFSTAHALTLWPVELVKASYFSFAPDLPLAGLPLRGPCKGGIRLRLRCSAGLNFSQTRIDALRFYLGGSEDAAFKLHELIGSACLGVLQGVGEQGRARFGFLPSETVRQPGFADDEALLPASARNFSGYRLLQEYFSFPQRYLFLELSGLAAMVATNDTPEMELMVLFGRGEAGLETVVDRSNFLLNCTPAINLFEKRIDRIQVSDSTSEFHVVPDRTRPMDFEIYDLREVTGYGSGVDSQQRFEPFYADYYGADSHPHGYYSLRREPRLYSERQQRGGARTSYIGSEVFLSLVDPSEAPYRSDLRQLSLLARCTNRDLPIIMPTGASASDFSLEVAAPVEAIRCVKGPSRPYSAVAEGAQAWSFISQLSLNYLSLLDTDARQGAAALRELLGLYASSAEVGLRKQVDGLRSIRCEPVITRLPMPGPLCFGRGLEVVLEMDEMFFEGGSAFLLGSVLEHFLARHVSINSFTETVLRTVVRGEIMHWPARCGLRPIL
ncbi:type VI secretion system baseplate subunit TssF [Zoogloea sp.]|uniref:type VI secretion system baseplate subunit TssF n=1 Tax=Zoogloea sp. TaxID=49181 RepID=UPI0035AE70B2